MHVKKQQKPFNIGLYYIHRYLRLTPPYAVMIMLQATLLRYVSSGPLFNSTVDLYANNCKENWWTNILYINNYVGVENQCIPQSWYLAIDMHLFILSPIILIPLWKLPRKWSLTILGVLICGGLITAFAVSFVEEFPASLFSANPDLVRLQYYPTHTRFTPWLIGVGYGYFFYETKRRNLKLSKLTVFLGWCMSNVAMLGTVHGVYAFYQDFSLQSINEHTTKDDTANIESSMYTTFARSSWALGVGWVAYACAFNYAGPINNLLPWKVFRPLSRLTYCAYLVHASYQVIQTYSTRTPSYISDLNIIQVIGGWMSASVCLLGAVYGILPFQQPDYDYNALESASYNCLHRTVWSFGVSWMIFACVSGYGGPLNSFLSWRAFLPFSRLSYCIYLVHYTFLIYRNFSSRVPAYLNDINVVSLYFGDLFLSILLAAALSLVFEVPIITMEKILLKRGEQQSSQERDTTRNVGITEGGNVNQGFTTHNKECKGSTTINIAVH